jgi:hypothetical protein
MNPKLISVTLFAFAVLLLAGCGGAGDQGPLSPSSENPPALTGASSESGDQSALAEGSEDSRNIGGHTLWGLWLAEYNNETGEFEVTLIREAQFHLNVVQYLQAPYPPCLAVHINSWSPATGVMDLNLTIKHPFPVSNLRGFDVRGIVMGDGGNVASALDPSILYPDPVLGMRLLNADGYTRWWNYMEFYTPGLYGFTPGNLGMKFFQPQSTLHGYKYYSDPLYPTDDVVPAVNMTNRGTFSTDMVPPELTRNYVLQFPMGPSGPKMNFQYAVDANWAAPTGGSPKPKPITDFPIQANCPEVYHIDVDTTGTTAWYEGGLSGGDLILAIEVFDWGAPTQPNGVNDEVASVWIESPTLFPAPISVPGPAVPGSLSTSGIYTITVPGVTPDALEDQEVLITVRSEAPTTYAPPVAGPVYPAGAILAAYKLLEIPIDDEKPEPGTIHVEAPNGGEVWYGGSNQTIQWTWTDPVPNVDILFSINSGGAYLTTLVSNYPNTGSLKWDNIPSLDFDTCRIKVVSSSDSAVFDESDADFAITSAAQPTITVIQPNGGGVWGIGSVQNVQWSWTGTISNVDIDLSLDGGLSFTVPIVSGMPNFGWYMVNPVGDWPTDQAIIRVQDAGTSGASDVSDSVFTILDMGEPITVIIPNGGETWLELTDEAITWSAIGTIGNVRIDLSLDSGLTYPTTISFFTTNDGAFLWEDIPSSAIGDMNRIKISNAFNLAEYDESDADFSVLANPWSLTLTVPNGGEVWDAGGSEDIEWESTGPVGDYVSLAYTVDGSFPVMIVGSTDNDGSYTWDPIADIESDEVKVSVSSVDFPYMTDESDDFFEISKPQSEITVTVPDGGESWMVGSAEEITWKSVGVTGQVMIAYTLDDLTSPITIIDATDNDGSFVWDPIPDTTTDTARVRITSVDSPSIWDQSDDYFKIVPLVDTITVIQPNGGEYLIANGTYEIKWDWTGSITAVQIYYSKDSGSNYDGTVTTYTPCDGSFIWDPVPDLDLDTIRIKIVSDDDTDVYDESDADFTIGPTPSGWLPVSGQTRVALTTPEPNQGAEPVDLMVFNAQQYESRGEIHDQADSDKFKRYNDDYTGLIPPEWEYGDFTEPLHKFDVLPDGSYVFVCNADSEKYPIETINDPTYCAFTGNNNETGERTGGGTSGYYFVYADSGDPDPDDFGWHRVVDWSCGVWGGIDDTTAWHICTFSDLPNNPQPHDGNIILMRWTTPYGFDEWQWYNVPVSTQGGGSGYVDDTDPGKMALAIDDDTELIFGPNQIVTGCWILDSTGYVQGIGFDFASGTYMAIEDKLDDAEFEGVGVDVECANAKTFGYSVSDTGFNWICVLIDNGDGTWSVGVWEYDYLGDPDPQYILIDKTDPIVGTPMALDVDGFDFEIHVLSENAGTIEATVFEYVP